MIKVCLTCHKYKSISDIDFEAVFQFLFKQKADLESTSTNNKNWFKATLVDEASHLKSFQYTEQHAWAKQYLNTLKDINRIVDFKKYEALIEARA